MLWTLQRIICAGLWWVCAGPLGEEAAGREPAALSQFVHQSWKMERGLPQNSVYSLLQDARGYIWLGTENGLVRFDGVRFEIFTSQTHPEFKDDFASSLARGPNGSIWIGTRGGGVFRYREGLFENISTNNGLSSEEVWVLASGNDGDLWVGTRRGLNRVNNGGVANFGVRDGLPHEHVKSLLPRPDGSVFAGTSEGGLTVRHADGTFEILSSEAKPFRTSVKTLVWDEGQDRLLIGLDGEGVYSYKDGRFEKIDFQEGEGPFFVHALLWDEEGAIWAGDEQHGVSRLLNGKVDRFGPEDGLGSGYVTALLKDREDNLWIGTQSVGLNRIREGKVRSFTRREGLLDENVTCIAEGREGEIFLGTARNGAFRMTGTGMTEIPLGDGVKKHIRALLWARDERLWVGTDGGGLAWVRGEEVQYVDPRVLPEEEITALYEDRLGRIWVGTKKRGVSYFEPSSGEFKLFTEIEAIQQHIRCFQEDGSGAILIGMQNGLAEYRNGRIAEWHLPGLDYLSARDFLVESNRVWIATRDHGIVRVEAGGKHTVFNRENGLPQNQVFTLFRSEGQVWFSTARGIQFASEAEMDAVAAGRLGRFETHILNEQDGMRTSECNGGYSRSGIAARDGKLWFGTKRGLTGIRPAVVVAARAAPPVLISAVSVDGEEFRPDQTGELPAGTSRVEFRYTALSLSESERIQFTHQLVGVDRAPVGPSTRREAAYYNLKPGKYQFHLRARDEHGSWDGAATTLSFVVLPRFYQTLWFYLALAGGAGAGIRGLHGWRLRKVRARAVELEELVAERTSELQHEVCKRIAAEERLVKANDLLESKVEDRTTELQDTLVRLKKELEERGRTEKALAESEARLSRVVHSGMVGILFWNKAGGVRDANDVFLQMVGYTRAELRSGRLEWRGLTPPEYSHLDDAALVEIQQNGVCAPFEKEYVRKDGSRLPVLVGGAAFLDDSESGVSFVIDVTAKREAEKKIHLLNATLEARVAERTAELAEANQRLAGEIVERERIAVAVTAFSRLGQKLHSAQTETDAAAIIAETAQRLLPHDVCSIQLYGANHKLNSVIELGSLPGAPDRQPEASISVPIRNGTRCVGLLSLRSSRSQPFDDADLHQLQALADYCAGALDRIHAEQARSEMERRFFAFMAHAPALAWMKDSNFRYVYTNRMFESFLGSQGSVIQGKTDFDLWPENLAAKLRGNDRKVMQSGTALETHETLHRPDGERTLLMFRFIFETASGEKFLAGMAIDVTEQKRAEEALHRLPQSILEAQETERRRVARELHDGVNQALASIKFRIQNAEQQIHRGDPRWQESFARTKEMLDSVLRQVRRLSRNLRPSELDDIGLASAARAACQEFETRTGIVVRFDLSGVQERFAPELELTLYRILQEALTNVEKHSGATEISVQLTRDDGYISLQFEDNGRGFGTVGDKPRDGLGLMHMRERASLVGGLFSLATNPGDGVRLTVHVPLKEAKSDG